MTELETLKLETQSQSEAVLDVSTVPTTCYVKNLNGRNILLLLGTGVPGSERFHHATPKRSEKEHPPG